MRQHNQVRTAWIPGALVALGLFVAGCGGGAPGGSPMLPPVPVVTPVPTPTVTTVSVACTPTSIATGATSQCTATVQGTGNYSSAVTWSASAGTISAAGLFTAPSSAGTVTVTATSVQDTTKSGQAAVTVQAPAPTSTITSVSASCNPATVNEGATSQCAAKVQGTGNYSSAVTWSASAGTINAMGLFTAPSSAGAVTVKATSVQDTTKSGQAAVTVQAPAPTSTITSVSASCHPATVNEGATSQCAATVQGTGNYSSAVTWSASAGTISAAGLFTAPSSAGTVTVKATSVQDTTKSGKTTVNVQAPAPTSTITSVSASCHPATVNEGATSKCAATVQGTGNFSSAVTWSASAGTISAAGLFTAPSSAGTVTVKATSVQDTTKSGKTTVTVQAPSAGIPQSKHVVLVMEENQSYSTVVGNSGAWPNLNRLIANGALPTNYYANTHPSIGNYFMLTTGKILTNDDSSITVWNVPNIARQMLAKGISFRIYAEGISRGYVGGNTGLYVIRHNPFAMLSDIADNSAVANRVIWPFSQFATDVANGKLPEFSYIVPDVDDDAHNGTPAQADAWLQKNVAAPLEGTAVFQPGGDGLLIVDFDEAFTSDTRHGGGHVAPVFWGPNVKKGFRQRSSTLYQHPSMLRTMMQALRVPGPPGAAASAPLMTEFFQ